MKIQQKDTKKRSNKKDKKGKKKRRIVIGNIVKKACHHCHKSHRRCSEQRPCLNCQKTGRDCYDHPIESNNSTGNEVLTAVQVIPVVVAQTPSVFAPQVANHAVKIEEPKFVDIPSFSVPLSLAQDLSWCFNCGDFALHQGSECLSCKSNGAISENAEFSFLETLDNGNSFFQTLPLHLHASPIPSQYTCDPFGLENNLGGLGSKSFF